MKSLSIKLWALFVFSFLHLPLCPEETWTINFEPLLPTRGQTLRVELFGAPKKAQVFIAFREKNWPFYNLDNPQGESTKRALIAVPADCPAGQYHLELKQKGLLRKIKLWEKSLAVLNKDFPKETIELEKQKTSLIDDPKASQGTQTIRDILKQDSPNQLWQEKFALPLEGRISSIYGIERVINNNIPWNYHKGLDLAALKGSLVQAPNNGRVVLVSEFPLQGLTVILDHGQGVKTIYMHLSEALVFQGAFLKKGSLIGKVGDTGMATAAHLHWGLYIYGIPVDPIEWTLRKF